MADTNYARIKATERSLLYVYHALITPITRHPPHTPSPNTHHPITRHPTPHHPSPTAHPSRTPNTHRAVFCP
ncbi:hypothetical protein EMB92_09750 [Bifidobacterium callitrichos]|uniref:Uncharacterized protein n=1 Tax=Bifidobacterium callitrichos TaxID=762209 RepID=A0A5M9ZB96_9BIFI|nr:hypothetical protein EMB92_09750 [Bifidobacterium callitrichos]